MGELEQGKITYDDIFNHHRLVWARHHTILEKWIAKKKLTQRTFRTRLVVYRGPPGTGKSSLCRFKFPKAYYKPPGQWWEGYSQEKVVILEEFSDKYCDINFFKTLVDSQPLTITSRTLQPLIITTNEANPAKWFPTADPVHLEAILRRIDMTVDFTKVPTPPAVPKFPKRCAPNKEYHNDRFVRLHHQYHRVADEGTPGKTKIRHISLKHLARSVLEEYHDRDPDDVLDELMQSSPDED